MNIKLLQNDKRYVIVSVIIIFILGSVFHFIYDVCGKLAVLAPFFPINESIWEHLKLSLYPILIVNLVLCNKAGLSIRKHLISSVFSIITSIFLIIVLYYALKYGFNIYSLPVDLSIYLISLIVGQLLFVHSEKHLNYTNNKFLLALIVLIVLIILFALFTFKAPELPIFQDPHSLTYGI
ncbi:MAG: DUF6512 family protein [Clostridiaceae bacterium]|nr:DUF6512 family protein [Clostridiaceae bacterium]